MGGVGARLDKLGKHGWHVLHSVPVGARGSDIDHVIIGPGGVWTVNTKRHPGKSIWVGRTTVLVDGHRQPYLRNSRHEAERASRLLTVACGFPVLVKAALVFLTGTLIPGVTVKQVPDGVAILDRTDIPRAFRRTKPTHRRPGHRRLRPGSPLDHLAAPDPRARAPAKPLSLRADTSVALGRVRIYLTHLAFRGPG